MNEGVLTGYDMRLCGCCGGIMISFSGTTAPYSGSYKLISNGADFGFNGAEKFPIAVKIDWVADSTSPCDKILIKRLKRK